jgi:hypothetical protein
MGAQYVFSGFGIEILQRSGRYFLGYVAGELVVQVRELELSAEDASAGCAKRTVRVRGNPSPYVRRRAMSLMLLNGDLRSFDAITLCRSLVSSNILTVASWLYRCLERSGRHATILEMHTRRLIRPASPSGSEPSFEANFPMMLNSRRAVIRTMSSSTGQSLSLTMRRDATLRSSSS